MARKKSVKKSATDFKSAADNITGFLSTVSSGQSDSHITWLHNYAIIRLYREFESLTLDCLIGAINNDTSTVSAKTGIQFPKHLTDEVCEYLVIGSGYFDFKGREGLIKTLKQFVPDDHYVITAVKKSKYKDPLEQLSALRNFAAHESGKSKRAALTAINAKNLSASGAWLKRQCRMRTIVTKLKELADEIHAAAPF
jgi:cupin superfamily acireductone dioxygenase involved in methionine salvage